MTVYTQIITDSKYFVVDSGWDTLFVSAVADDLVVPTLKDETGHVKAFKGLENVKRTLTCKANL